MNIASDISSRWETISKALRNGNLSAKDSAALGANFAYVLKDGDSPLLGMGRGGAANINDSTDDYIPFTVSVLQEDRDGDVVVPLGARLENYARNPVVFFGHQEWEIPIGVSRSLDGELCVFPEHDQIKAYWFPDRADPDAAFIEGKVRRGILSASSIAFVPIVAYKRDDIRKAHRSDGSGSGWYFEEYDFTEWSIVGVPSNAGAIRDVLDSEKSFITPRLQKALGGYAAKARIKGAKAWPSFRCPPGGCKVSVTKSTKGKSVAKIVSGGEDWVVVNGNRYLTFLGSGHQSGFARNAQPSWTDNIRYAFMYDPEDAQKLASKFGGKPARKSDYTKSNKPCGCKSCKESKPCPCAKSGKSVAKGKINWDTLEGLPPWLERGAKVRLPDGTTGTVTAIWEDKKDSTGFGVSVGSLARDGGNKTFPGSKIRQKSVSKADATRSRPLSDGTFIERLNAWEDYDENDQRKYNPAGWYILWEGEVPHGPYNSEQQARNELARGRRGKSVNSQVRKGRVGESVLRRGANQPPPKVGDKIRVVQPGGSQYDIEMATITSVGQPVEDRQPDAYGGFKKIKKYPVKYEVKSLNSTSGTVVKGEWWMPVGQMRGIAKIVLERAYGAKYERAAEKVIALVDAKKSKEEIEATTDWKTVYSWWNSSFKSLNSTSGTAGGYLVGKAEPCPFCGDDCDGNCNPTKSVKKAKRGTFPGRYEVKPRQTSNGTVMYFVWDNHLGRFTTHGPFKTKLDAQGVVSRLSTDDDEEKSISKGNNMATKTKKKPVAKKKKAIEEPIDEELDLDEEDMETKDEEPFDPKPSAMVMASLYSHAKSEGDYLDGELAKMDNPNAHEALTKYKEEHVEPRMEGLKSMLEEHYPDHDLDKCMKAIEDDEDHVEKMETDGGSGIEDETGEDNLVASGNIPKGRRKSITKLDEEDDEMESFNEPENKSIKEVEVDDRVKFDGKTYTVININPKPSSNPSDPLYQLLTPDGKSLWVRGSRITKSITKLDEEEEEKSEVGSEEWAEEEAMEPEHQDKDMDDLDEEKSDLHPDEEKDEMEDNPDTEEILERYQHPKSKKWMTRKASVATIAKAMKNGGSIRYTNDNRAFLVKGKVKDLTDEGNPAELKEDEDELIKASNFLKEVVEEDDVPKTCKDVADDMADELGKGDLEDEAIHKIADDMEEMAEDDEIPKRVKAGFRHYAKKLKKSVKVKEGVTGPEEEEAEEKDLTDQGSMDGVGSEMTDEGNPAETKEFPEEDGEKDLDNEGNPAELKDNEEEDEKLKRRKMNGKSKQVSPRVAKEMDNLLAKFRLYTGVAI